MTERLAWLWLSLLWALALAQALAQALAADVKLEASTSYPAQRCYLAYSVYVRGWPCSSKEM